MLPLYIVFILYILVLSGPSPGHGVSTSLINSSSTDSGGVGTANSGTYSATGTDAPFGVFSSPRYTMHREF